MKVNEHIQFSGDFGFIGIGGYDGDWEPAVNATMVVRLRKGEEGCMGWTLTMLIIIYHFADIPILPYLDSEKVVYLD